MAADLNNLSISELKEIKKDNQQKLKKEYEELKKKQKLIEEITKIQKTREKINKNQKPKPKPVDPVLEYKRLVKKFSSNKVEKINMTFDEYFQKCIQGKKIPADAPPYMRKALQRAIREFGQGIEKEKSSLENFATKYAISGSLDNIEPFEYFKSKSSYLKDFLRNHPNIKVKFILVCLMEKKEWEKDYLMTINDKAYFNSDTYINIESTDVKEILAKVISKILESVSEIVADSPAAIFPSLSMSTLAESHTDMTNPIQHVYQNNNTLHRRTISQTICFGETPTPVTNGETPANDRKSKTAIRLDSNNSSPK